MNDEELSNFCGRPSVILSMTGQGDGAYLGQAVQDQLDGHGAEKNAQEHSAWLQSHHSHLAINSKAAKNVRQRA